MRQFVLELGAAAWTVEGTEVDAYLDQLDSALAAGRFAAIGEIHVDSTASYFTGTPPIRYPADAPLMQRLWTMSAAHGVPLSVHMDGSPDSVASMERLLASDRRGTWLWAHTGHYTEAPVVRRLLEAHPNLYCELSYRSSISPSRTAVPLDDNGVLQLEWRELLEDFPDRFVLGTDLSAPSHAEYTRHISFWRAILEQVSPETAAQIAYSNAEQLLQPRD
jgi:predicted TIM-barrel fold metal-dependent hydrolase